MSASYWVFFWGFLAGANFFIAVQGIGSWPWLSALAVIFSVINAYTTTRRHVHSLAQAVTSYITAILAMHGIKNPDLPHEKKE